MSTAIQELEALDLSSSHYNLSPARLIEAAIRHGEARLSEHGALVAYTGEHTGRSPRDRFLVRHPQSESEISWGEINRPIAASHFDALYSLVKARLEKVRPYVFEGFAGADPEHRLRVRVVTERAWHSLFAHNMFLRQPPSAIDPAFEADFTVLDAPSVVADPNQHGTRSGTFVLLDLDRRIAVIGGTEYAGEIKKSVFSVMNYQLPRAGVLSMHCSANYGAAHDTALFFGLSGTGKTTLSADPDRTLVGDDEHGWSDRGIFNIEGGCYAKVIRLDPRSEPEIYATTRRFGTILENVVLDDGTGALDLDDDRLTENTRSSYPLTQLGNVDLDGMAGHPRHVVFLTCDAFGVLPPIARLDEAQAAYHFLAGYTAKVAGTERGVTEPQATFSTCFGAPFMPLQPARYAQMLSDRIARHQARVWLVNTGWTGGSYGVGRRMALGDTRKLLEAAISGALEEVPYRTDPVFGLSVPERVEGVSSSLLVPRDTWGDAASYDKRAEGLARMFEEGFRPFAASVSEAVRKVAPRI